MLALLLSIGLTALWVFVLVFSQKYATLYPATQSKQILTVARVIVAGVAGWMIATTSFVSSSLYLAAGFTDSFYTDLGPLASGLFTPFMQMLTANAWALGLLQVATVAGLALVAGGYALRITLPITIGLYFVVLGTLLKASLGGHLGLQSFYLLVVLWGIYETLAYYRRSNSRSQAMLYTQAVYVLFIAIAVPYTFAVINKLKILGVAWFDSANIRSYLHVNEYLGYEYWQWPLSLWSTTWPHELFYIGGIAVVLLQLVYVLMVFFSWARLLLSVAIILMHVAIYSFMGFLFYDLILIQVIILYAYFLGRKNGVVTGVRPLSWVFVGALGVMIFIPMYLTIIDKTWFPFTNWGVYYQPSTRLTGDSFPYTSIHMQYENGTSEQLSIPAFQRLAGIYTYPRARCYWRFDVAMHVADCRLYFDRIVDIHNERLPQAEHIAHVQLTFHYWRLSELQSQQPSMSTSSTIRVY